VQVQPGNVVEVEGPVTLAGEILGRNNKVRVSAEQPTTLKIRINGNDNQITVLHAVAVRETSIRIGTHVPASNCTFEAKRGLSTEAGTQFLLPNQRNTILVGEYCMFSNNIKVRAGDSPHLLFDADTGEYLDVTDGIRIGNHVWVGEGVYITKNAVIADETIVAARAVVTRKFHEPFTALGGNPARVIRTRVRWIRNRGLLEPGTLERTSYERTWGPLD
jgi:acetyltransferase-like isoleucine patch superfamily enzyme